MTSKIKCAKRLYFENDLLSSTCNQSKSIWDSVKLVLGNKKSNNSTNICQYWSKAERTSEVLQANK